MTLNTGRGRSERGADSQALAIPAPWPVVLLLTFCDVLPASCITHTCCLSRPALFSPTPRVSSKKCRRCCAENPAARPALREVSEKVKSIQEAGQKTTEVPSSSSSSLLPAGPASAGAGAGAGAGVADRSITTAGATIIADPSVQQGHGDDLLELFDNVHSTRNGRMGNTSGSGASVSAAAGNNRPPPRRPPPPYDTAIQGSPPKPSVARLPPYREALGTEGTLVPIEGEGQDPPPRGYPSGGAVSTESGGGDASLPPPLPPREGGDEGDAVGELVTLEEVDGGGGERSEVGVAIPAAATGRGTDEWWSVSTAREPYVEVSGSRGSGSGRGMGTRGLAGAVGVGDAAGAGARPSPSQPSLGLPGVNGPSASYNDIGSGTAELGVGGRKNRSISCTRSTSFSEYGVTLPGVLQAAKGGGVLSSNPRLLCVCCPAGPPQEDASGGAAGAGTAGGGGGAAVLQAEGAARDAGHVSVLDLWHRGRTVRYPVAADRAAMSPNQSESVIAVLGGGSLHVFSIPRRCRLQEQAVATALCMWR